jgi:UDP-galactopyranose mutase
MSDKDINLVVGAGFSGATIANLLADKADEKVLIIDKNSHIGGSCYDYRDKNGIMIHAYGSHIFHTNSQKVWIILNNLPILIPICTRL